MEKFYEPIEVENRGRSNIEKFFGHFAAGVKRVNINDLFQNKKPPKDGLK